MSKAVADLMNAFPESSFDNTGGGCMVVAVPVPSADRPDGAVIITGSYGHCGCDNFSRRESDPNGANGDLTGFYATYHAEWYSEDPQDVDPVDVYTSEAYSPFDGLDVDSPEYPEDEQAYADQMNREHAAAEVVKTVSAVRYILAILSGDGE